MVLIPPEAETSLTVWVVGRWFQVKDDRQLWESLGNSPDLRIQHGRSAYPQLWKLQSYYTIYN